MTYQKGIPDYAMVPAKEAAEPVIVPITKGAVYSPVQVTNITEKPKTVITIEEDILVPDIKPDLKEILIIDGKARLSSREAEGIAKGDDYVNLMGDIELQTLYLPEKQDSQCPVMSIQTRVPFKDRWHTSISPGATVILDCSIESIEHVVINERKFRVKISLAIKAFEYIDRKIDIFEGLFDEELQLLKEKAEICSITLRKKDSLIIKEDIIPKDDTHPETILKQDINVVENYKQIAGDKVVINGFIYVSLLYFRSSEENSSDNIYQMQERIEFTQFIPVQQGNRQTGCNTFFDDSQLKVKICRSDEDQDIFRLEGELITYIELYRASEKEIIVDGYHRQKDFICDFAEESSRTVIGTSTGETSVRELVTPENASCDIDKIIYTTAEISGAESRCEQGKIITEGNIIIKLICRGDGDDGNIFSLRQPVPFRVVSAMPQLAGDETVYHKICIRDIWAEKINGKQLEFNAGLLVCADVMRLSPFKILINPAFREGSNEKNVPPMVIYICKEGDRLWNIAKKFKTTVESVMLTNELESEDLSAGRKLLIIK